MISSTDVFFNLAGNAGALAFVFWLSWRLTKHTIPNLLRSFERALSEQRDSFREETKQTREDFMNALEKAEKFFAEQIERERDLQQEQTRNITLAIQSLGHEPKNSGYRQRF